MGKGAPKWFAYLNNQTGQVYNDEYDYLPWWWDPTHEEYEYPGHWGAHWNEQIGRGLIINVKGLVNLRSLDVWMYDGGSQVDGFEEVQDYHWMFLEPYAPEIISSEGG